MSKYLAFIWADGMPSADELAVMQRELPRWSDEVERRGVPRFGRELDLPATAAAVRVRDGETLVSDGPFAETKEFIAGFDLYDCADRDQAIDVAATCPVSWFAAIEVRPYTGGPLSGQAAAFGRGEDGTGQPYLLVVWTDAMLDAAEAWRRDAAARGLYLMGSTLGAADAVTTVRVRDEKRLLSKGPMAPAGAFIAAIEVVSCTSREQVIQLAAAHPAAGQHAIEVRPFWSE